MFPQELTRMTLPGKTITVRQPEKGRN